MYNNNNKIIKLNKCSVIEEGLRFLRDTIFCTKKDVIKQKSSSLGVTIVNEKKYKIETVVRAFEYFTISRSCCNRLMQDLQLLSIRTLTRLTSPVKSLNDASFMKSVFSNLNDARKKKGFWFKTKLMSTQPYTIMMEFYLGKLPITQVEW